MVIAKYYLTPSSKGFRKDCADMDFDIKFLDNESLRDANDNYKN